MKVSHGDIKDWLSLQVLPFRRSTISSDWRDFCEEWPVNNASHRTARHSMSLTMSSDRQLAVSTESLKYEAKRLPVAMPIDCHDRQTKCLLRRVVTRQAWCTPATWCYEIVRTWPSATFSSYIVVDSIVAGVAFTHN